MSGPIETPGIDAPVAALADDPRYRAEARRLHAMLVRIVTESGSPFTTLEAALGWPTGKLELVLTQAEDLELGDLVVILGALGRSPVDFWREVFPFKDRKLAPLEPGPRGDAPPLLGRLPPLVPATPSYLRHYVDRPSWPAGVAWLERLSQGEHGLSLLAGQRGVGKSTELERLLHALPLHVIVRLTPAEAAVDEVILRRAAEAATREVATRFSLDPEIDDLPVPDAAAQADMTAAGAAGYRALLARLGPALEALRWSPLLLVDGLDHGERAEAGAWLQDHRARLESFGWTVIVTAPLYTRPGDEVTLAPIPVYADPSATAISDAGRAFFERLISPYLPLERIDPPARDALAWLSAGLPGALLTFTRAACEASRGRVGLGQVEEVYRAERARRVEAVGFESLAFLRAVAAEPQRFSLDDVAPHFDAGAIILHEGADGVWPCVHPVFRRFFTP